MLYTASCCPTALQRQCHVLYTVNAGLLHLKTVNIHIQPILQPGKRAGSDAAWALPRIQGALPAMQREATGVSSFAFQVSSVLQVKQM